MTFTGVESDAVVSRVVDVDGIPMSALVREVREPRAVIVALHGGAATARYFHYPDQPRLSLLETGAALGFTVIALDRPGYGSSRPHADALVSAERRVDAAYTAIDQLLGAKPRGAGLFLLAHSAGCELAVRMAADERGGDLLGLELAGTGRIFHPTAQKILEAVRANGLGRRKPTGLQGILWEPMSCYPPGVVGGAHFVSRAPGYESAVVQEWAPRNFALTAPKVRVPVQYTLGDHDLVWRNDPASMADIAALFTASPRAVTNEQANSGHNLSLGLTAMAYHLKVLSFVEECVLRQDRR